MKITNISLLTGKENEMDLNVTEEQLQAWRNGGLIQEVMAHLSVSEREFLVSGATQEEWEEVFGKAPKR